MLHEISKLVPKYLKLSAKKTFKVGVNKTQNLSGNSPKLVNIDFFSGVDIKICPKKFSNRAETFKISAEKLFNRFYLRREQLGNQDFHLAPF